MITVPSPLFSSRISLLIFILKILLFIYVIFIFKLLSCASIQNTFPLKIIIFLTSSDWLIVFIFCHSPVRSSKTKPLQTEGTATSILNFAHNGLPKCGIFPTDTWIQRGFFWLVSRKDHILFFVQCCPCTRVGTDTIARSWHPEHKHPVPGMDEQLYQEQVEEMFSSPKGEVWWCALLGWLKMSFDNY